MDERTPTMTRRDIARSVAADLQLPTQEADRIVSCVLDSIRDLLMRADPEIRLEIRDFGVFEVKLTKAKPRARNPKTGSLVYVPPRRKTHFKPSKLLKSFLTRPLAEDALRFLQKRGMREEEKAASAVGAHTG